MNKNAIEQYIADLKESLQENLLSFWEDQDPEVMDSMCEVILSTFNEVPKPYTEATYTEAVDQYGLKGTLSACEENYVFEGTFKDHPIKLKVTPYYDQPGCLVQDVEVLEDPEGIEEDFDCSDAPMVFDEMELQPLH